MSLPTCKSKYKGACKKCKVEYTAGTEIYKINEDYWCSNPKCPGSPGETTSEVAAATPKSVDLEAKLDQIWDIAFAKASKIVDETYSDKELVDKFERKKQKLIMAQTFVKALCGHAD